MKPKLIKAVCIVVSFILLSAYYINTEGFPNKSALQREIQITFLDVGQGDCILIDLPGGDVLIDAGPDKATDGLLASLKTRGIEAISLFFITHADADHAAGADDIISNFNVDRLFISNLTADSESLVSIKAAAFERGCILSECSSGDVFLSGELKIEVLSPANLSGDDNSDSLVLLVTYGSNRFILMGDADASAESKILSFYKDKNLRADIIKAGHHGSRTSSSEAWLKAVNPAYCVISCGKANSFGHPNADVESRYERLGATVLRTDKLGDITFSCDGTAVTLVS